jgi:hypothetical protein
MSLQMIDPSSKYVLVANYAMDYSMMTIAINQSY